MTTDQIRTPHPRRFAATVALTVSLAAVPTTEARQEKEQKAMTTIVVTQKVADFQAWKKVFLQYSDKRKASGISGHRLFAPLNQLGVVTIQFDVSDPVKASGYFESPELLEVMKRAGVLGKPSIFRGAEIANETLGKASHYTGYTVFIRHKVAALPKWKAAFDAFHDQQAKVFSGTTVLHEMRDGNDVMVSHSGSDVTAIQAFLSSPALKERMQTAGVASAPEISITSDGEAATY
jgi:hypothetical protein